MTHKPMAQMISGSSHTTRGKRFMIIAGEPSGDALAAELVRALRDESGDQSLEFFGAGGARMVEAGVDVALDMTAHSVIGLVEALKGYWKFRGILNQLVRLAFQRRPDVIVCIDFSGFNRRFAHQIREDLKTFSDLAEDWTPKIVQYVSPQVWASRPGRAKSMARDYDLLLSIFPFEKKWYADRVPEMRVEFVGHPIVDRHANAQRETRNAESETPLVLLLPGSRPGELRRHLPVLAPAAQLVSAQRAVRLRMVLPDAGLLALAREIAGDHLRNVDLRVGGLQESLAEATVALASTGTVTMECAWFGVPTVAFYKTSWSTYQIGKRIVQVKYLAMPNILADEPLFPELIQNDATPQRIATEALGLLTDKARRHQIQSKLAQIVKSLGSPGAAQRAAQHVLSLLNWKTSHESGN